MRNILVGMACFMIGAAALVAAPASAEDGYWECAIGGKKIVGYDCDHYRYDHPGHASQVGYCEFFILGGCTKDSGTPLQG